MFRLSFTRLSMASATTSASPAPSFYVLQYQYVPDILTKRQPYRAAHLENCRKYIDSNRLVLGGALGDAESSTDPVDSALLVFRDVSPAEIAAFAEADPYVVNGLVTDRKIRKWNVVIGSAM
eukprot:TRINITY_DN35166_c0_g1_i1.p1 TRINITY_DN35166_c0_g1~~TRINITY_DN35166_c0_g1_i1.p1  ORF type:complete len:122 (-),score=5.90 TRINITY_DN35166_c0_g1_i1:159-524(-)